MVVSWAFMCILYTGPCKNYSFIGLSLSLDLIIIIIIYLRTQAVQAVQIK